MASIDICNIDQLKARTRPEPEKQDPTPPERTHQALLATLRERLAAPQRVEILLEDL